ncbi:MAG: Gfo/Idh/MocA family protein [Hyphomicrobium sp.]|uniref:Gfo/Idh/MocA family protein n=1 Tax=Hyphomicrobium sp. TaxID=82 RepID=UPI003D0BE4B5
MISVGVIGYGYWGPNLARNSAEASGTSLAAVADFSPQALQRAGKRYPGIKLYSDPSELIADPAVDAVMIATPVSTHFDLALAALQAGKHVFVEKPMTRTARESRILIAEAARRNLTLMVDHTFVYTPAVRKIREFIDTGKLGDLYYYDSTRVNLGLFQSDVNVMWDLAVHDFSILEYLLDGQQPTAVSAGGTRHIAGRPENMAHVTLYYDSGTVAHLNVNWLAPAKIRQTLIGGSKSMIIYDDLEPSEKIKVYDRGVDLEPRGKEQEAQLRVSYRMGDMWAPQLTVREALLDEIEHFASCINAGTVPLTSGQSGLGVVEMLEAATLSMQRRGAPIELGEFRIAS